MSWTDEQVAKAKRLWLDGFSASQIGAQVQKTRNAVIGKAMRGGWTSEGRHPAARPGRPNARKTAPRERAPTYLAAHLATVRAPSAPIEPPPAAREPEPPSHVSVAAPKPSAPAQPSAPALLDARREMLRAALAKRTAAVAPPPARPPAEPGHRTCAWLSDGADASCAAAAREGGRYCEHHHGRVYQVGTALTPKGLRTMARGAERSRRAPDEDDELLPLDEEVA